MSQANSEIELTFYAKIGDHNALSQAEYSEEHVQLEARLMDGNKIRVRKTTKIPDGTSEYIFTAKRKNPGQDVEGEKITDTTEYSVPVNEEFLNTFSEIMEQKIIKTRYYFKNSSIVLTIEGQPTPIVIDNLGFEIDIFKTRGEICEYVKVDVEVDPLLAYLDEHFPELESFNLKIKTSTLPIKLTDLIYKPTATEEQKALVKDLWENHYTIKRLPTEEPTA